MKKTKTTKTATKKTVAKAPAKEKHVKNGLTELVFILDRSGSMGGLETDTIGGFNSMIEKQKRKAGSVLVSTVLFDDKMEVLHDRLPLQLIRPMTEREYFVRGSTALLDAIGRGINHIGNIQKYTAPEQRPEHTLFVITTDGMENASREYPSDTVKKMIERQKERFGWEFIFLGANINSVASAAGIGIDADHAVNYLHDAQGTKMNYACVCEAVTNVRDRGCLSSGATPHAWRKAVDKDYKARKK